MLSAVLCLIVYDSGWCSNLFILSGRRSHMTDLCFTSFSFQLVHLRVSWLSVDPISFLATKSWPLWASYVCSEWNSQDSLPAFQGSLVCSLLIHCSAYFRRGTWPVPVTVDWYSLSQHKQLVTSPHLSGDEGQWHSVNFGEEAHDSTACT